MTTNVNSDTLVSQGNLDVDSFSDVVNDLLSKAWGDDWGSFQLDEAIGDEPEATTIPIITYDYEKRVRSKSHPSLDPVLFDSFTDKDNAQIVKVFRQWFDVRMVFKIYHSTNRQAMELMADFEDFLFTYKGHLKKLGLSEIIFEEEQQPQIRKEWSKHTVQRTLVYSVRLERLTEQRSNIGKSISFVDSDTTSNPMYGNSEILNHYAGTQKIKQ